VERSTADAAPRLRVYAARSGGRVFIMILNREVGQAQTVRLILDGEADVALRLPPRSYTSLVVDDQQVRISGIGG
jgi:O-glycosyl hydrolase